MPGLVLGIHAFRSAKQGVDGRDKPGHDVATLYYCTLMPASLMIECHLSISALVNAASAAAVCCSGGGSCWPRSNSRLRTAGSAIAARAAAPSLSMAACGAPFGSQRPYHVEM